jgi:hypothetical protein
MKLKITTNFSFDKLANKTNGIVKKYIKDYATNSALGTKLNINNSKDVNGKPLTLDRKSYRANQKPLVRTGKFLKSIEVRGEKLTMLKYGKKHSFGEWDHLLKGTYTANFIGIADNNLNIKENIDKEFAKNINKALKK